MFGKKRGRFNIITSKLSIVVFIFFRNDENEGESSKDLCSAVKRSHGSW